MRNRSPIIKKTCIAEIMLKFIAPNMAHITSDTRAQVFNQMPKPVTLNDMTQQ